MIEIKNLSKSYGKNKVISCFNCKIKDGVLLAIVGESGCGKSTLLNILGLLDKDYDGEVLYDGKVISKMNTRKRNEFIRNNINYLFQNYALIDEDNVEENLLLALEYEKLSKKEKIQKINNALEMVNLRDFNNKKVYTLSGGEQQRISLARIILKQGDIILADEPTGNLDKENSKMVINILKKLRKKGRTVLIVTHDRDIAKQCDDIIELPKL